VDNTANMAAWELQARQELVENFRPIKVTSDNFVENTVRREEMGVSWRGIKLQIFYNTYSFISKMLQI